jgi:hypothetical protein
LYNPIGEEKALPWAVGLIFLEEFSKEPLEKKEGNF